MRKELEDIIFIGGIQEEVEIANKKWVLKTISSEEQVLALSKISSYDMTSRAFASRVEFLMYSLQSVNGIKFDDPEEKRTFINKLQPFIILRLDSAYEDLLKKQNETFKDPEEIKN